MTHAQQLLPHRHPLKGLEAFFTSGNEPTKSETVTIRTSRFFEELAKAVAELEALKAREPMTEAEITSLFDEFATQEVDSPIEALTAVIRRAEAHHNIKADKGDV